MFSEAGTKPNPKTKSSCRTASIPSRSFKTLALLSWAGGGAKYQLVTCNILQFAMKKVQNTKANSIKLDNP